MELYNLFCRIESATVILKFNKVYLNVRTSNYLVINDKVREDTNRRVSIVLSIENLDKVPDLFVGQDLEYKFLIESESKIKEKDGYCINQYKAHDFTFAQ